MKKQPPREFLPGEKRTFRRSRIVIGLMVLLTICALTFVVVLYRRRSAPATLGPYATLPFRPKVSYSASSLTVTNTEKDSYLDTQLTLFVGWTYCRASAGTILPGKEISIPLSSFIYEDGKFFDPAQTKAKLLEVRAHMNGYELHRDLPPPP